MVKEKVIKPHSGFVLWDEFAELIAYRELFLTFVERDLRVRYKQTVVGGVWAVMQPVLTMVVFSFFFGRLANIPSDGVPYPVFSYAGLTLWTYFTNAISSASVSLVSNSQLLTKVYFPRLIIPLASTLTGVVDYAIASAVLVLMLWYFEISPSALIVLLPVVVGLTWLLATGMGLWLSAINVKYRDVRHAMPFFLQLLIFVSPVIYPSSVAERFKFVLFLNPMTGLLGVHRAMILNTPLSYGELAASVFWTVVIFVSGLFYFKKIERQFADIV